MDLPQSTREQKECLGRKLSRDNKRQDSVRDWLTTTVDEDDAKPEAATASGVPLWRSPSAEDDLALGVEASLYGRQGVKTVQEFLRSTRSSPSFSRWNSFNSVGSSHSAPLSVMDVLNMWMDDPEELLLDLGFGCDEPDISGRIPARFINAPSQARGISIQVFLEAQKSRLDLENPDVSNRFRQLEVLHQVTTAFTSLVGAGPVKAPGSTPAKNLPAEAQERRRRMGLLLRRASKMSFNPDPGGAVDERAPPLRGDKKALGVKSPLTPLAEEVSQAVQGLPEQHFPQALVDLHLQEGTARLEPLKEDQPLDTSSSQRKRSPGKARESFEMEEVHSFDEGSVVSGYTGGPENIVWGIIRTNSTQSDSSGFLEEPSVPSLPGPELIKTLAGLSGGSTDSQTTARETSSPPPSPSPHNLSLSSVRPPYSSPETTPPSRGEGGAAVAPPSPPSPAASSPPPAHLPLSAGPPSGGPQRQAGHPRPSETGPGPDVAPGPRLAAPPLSPVVEENTETPTPGSPPLMPTSPMTSVSPPSFVRPATHHSQRGYSEEEPHGENRGNGSIEAEPHRGNASLEEEPHGPNRGNGSPEEEPHRGSGSLEEEQYRGSSSLEKEPYTLNNSLEEEPHGRSKQDEGSSPTGPSPPHNTRLGVLELCSTQTKNSEEESYQPGPSLHPAPSSRQDHACGSEDVTVGVLEDRNPGPSSSGSSVQDVDPGKTDLLAGGSERSSLVPCGGVEDSGEHGAQKRGGVVQDAGWAARSGTDTDLAVRGNGSGSRPQLQPLMVETDIDSAGSAPSGHEGLPQGEANRTKHCENRWSGRCHIVETNIDEVDGASALEGSRTHPQALAGETKPRRKALCGRVTGLLETDLDDIESTVVGQGSGSNFEGLAGGAKLWLRSYEVMETDIDALEGAAEAPGGSGRVHELLETHIDEPGRGHTGVSQEKGGERSGGVTLTRRPAGPIAVQSLGEVFETSLDGSPWDSEDGDVDAVCLELESDGFAYWAEPVRVSSTSPAVSPAETATPGLDYGPVGLDCSSSNPDHLKTLFCVTVDGSVGVETHSPPPSPSHSPPAHHGQNLKRRRSVSVQMPSCPSTRTVSHIVKRKDVPYAPAAPKPSLMSTSLPCLDTSSPLRAVQSWTDLQLRRRGLNATLWGRLQASQSQGSLRVRPAELRLSPATVFSSDPTFRTTSNSRWSTDSMPESPASFQSNSVSLDTGLWPEDEDSDARGEEGTDRLEETLWEGSQGKQECCCCDRQHPGQTRLRKQPSTQSLPYSQDELESMIFCLRRFRVVLADIEEQVSEEQALVFSALSDSIREEACDITELRRAVKQEAGNLELQLKELAHHYDENFQMKMHRLLNEQSLLCSQLRLLHPPVTTAPPAGGPAVRSVSTQCSLPPVPVAPPPGDPRASADLPPSPEGPGMDSPVMDSPTLGCSATKPDKMDFVGFLQRLKESLRPSVNSESLE